MQNGHNVSTSPARHSFSFGADGMAGSNSSAGMSFWNVEELQFEAVTEHSKLLLYAARKFDNDFMIYLFILKGFPCQLS